MDEDVLDGDADKSKSGRDSRGRNRDSIVNLVPSGMGEGTLKLPPWEYNGGIGSDDK